MVALGDACDQTFQRVWVVLIKDLHQIANDPSFDPKRIAQPKARRLYNQITNRSVLLYMYFFCDMVKEFAQWTEKTQEANALLIEQIKWKNKITSKLEQLKNPNDDPAMYGEKLKEFFDDIECTMDTIIYSKNSPAGRCTEEHYYEAEQVKYKGHVLQAMLRADDPSSVGIGDEDAAEKKTIASLKGPKLLSLRLNSIRDDVLTLLQEEVESYFPEDSLDSFSVMDPESMPKDPNEYADYGEHDIRKLVKAFGYENYVEEIVDGWLQLMTVFSQQRWMCIPSMRINKPALFWTWVLKTYGPDFEADHPRLLRFLRHIMVVPATSSAAERAFSSLKWIRNDRRSLLSARQIENLMRVKINGNDDLSRFHAFDWAKKWVKAGHQRADDGKRSGKKAVKRAEKEEEKKTFQSDLF